MHPIDVICGSFSYQCQPSPFTLRPDDIGSISSLYPIAPASVPAGKTATLADADQINGSVTFANGQGMQGVNLTVRRHQFATDYDDPGDIVSAVTGIIFRWNNGNVVTGPLPSSTAQASIAASMGAGNPGVEGNFLIPFIPIMAGQTSDDAIVTGQPINPLYSGIHSVGPYQSGPVAPSGSYGFQDNDVRPFESNSYNLSATGAATTPCPTPGEGTANAPASIASNGFWTGALCSYANVGWNVLPVAANRSFTVEITALDDQSHSTTTKLQPVIGVWNLTDPTNVLPTVAATPGPFNALALGMTSVTAATSAAGTLRLAIADDRGDGRPDYTYRARLLYAASVSPSNIPASGGAIIVSGMGFRPGCQLSIGDVAVPVLSSTTNTLIAEAPPFAELNAGSTTALDLTVTDPTTGGTSTMSAVLNYPASAVPATAESITAITPQVYVPAGLAVPVLEQAVASAANAALPGLAVDWAAAPANPSGAVAFSNTAQTVPSAATLATVTTTEGIAAVTATLGPLAAGSSVSGQACITPTLCTTFTATAVDPAQWTPVPLLNASQTVPSTGVLLPVVAEITDLAGHTIVGAPATAYQTVTAYEPPCPPTGACPVPVTLAATQTPLVSDANGLVVIEPLQFGQSPQTLHLALSTGTQSLLALTLTKNP